ncbi:MAG: HAD family hydrolase [Gimesia chilikensis]|uniref:HAD family hydrolase n=1 Tax=Gimesia chilikensis TaxID=2605989 RepID=UPI0037B0D2B5
MIKAVIFDLYGTLLELTQDHRPFLQVAKHYASLSVQAAIHKALINDCPTLKAYASLLRLKTQLNLERLEQILADDLLKVRLFPDVLVTLEKLQAQQVKTGVISNLATPYIRPFDSHKLRSHFDVVLFSCECGLSKPDPAIYQRAVQQLNLAPEEILMVGDSYASDVVGPETAGIKGIHLVRSGEDSSASAVISGLESLFDFV